MIFKKLFRKTIRFSVLMLAVACSACGRKQAAETDQSQQSSSSSGMAKVTFVELGSVNCVPCRMMVPVMKQVEENFSGQVKVVFYDVWTKEGQPAGQYYRIRAIPTQVFLDPQGREFYRHEGYFPYDELVKVLRMQGVK